MFPSTPATTIVDAIVAAEELGIDEFWLGDEGPARDPFTVLAAAAMRTSRILLGIAVTNPYLRHPLTIAAEAMTVDELSGGRMLLGIGPGGQVALGPAGVERALPLTRVRDALRTIRAVATGTEAAGYAPPPGVFTRPQLKVFVGSRGQKFQELASAEADGAFLGGLPASVIERTVGWARSVRDIPIALPTPSCEIRRSFSSFRKDRCFNRWYTANANGPISGANTASSRQFMSQPRAVRMPAAR
ncbi:MAG: LLM class flavin-dependent oxidoreductase, partial [Actinomycetota bacterium]